MKPALAVLLLLVSGAATQGRESLCQDCEILPSNPFTSNKCINGVLAWNGTVYNCRCHNTSWTGTACDERPWWWNETLNEAEKKCVNGYQNWKSECVCYSAWTGRRCDVRRCVNGILSWSQEDRNMSCRCDKNWEGPACDQRPFWWQDALQTRPPNPGYQRCMNGYRTGSFGRQICECYSGWTGEECAIRQGRLENKTSNIPCYNGNIQYRFGVARCACYTSWRGAACDEMECLHGFFNYNNTCECFDGFAGWNCDHCESPYDSYPSCARPWYKTVLRALKTAAEWTLDRLRTVNWVYVVIILFVALIAYKMLRRSLIKAMKDRDAKQCRAVANVAPPAYNEGCNRGHTFVNPNYETELLIDCSNEIVQPTIHATLPRPWLSV